jgi:hypothetical protein
MDEAAGVRRRIIPTIAPASRRPERRRMVGREEPDFIRGAL